MRKRDDRGTTTPTQRPGPNSIVRRCSEVHKWAVLAEVESLARRRSIESQRQLSDRVRANEWTGKWLFREHPGDGKAEFYGRNTATFYRRQSLNG